jgi:hypothetical protein
MSNAKAIRRTIEAGVKNALNATTFGIATPLFNVARSAIGGLTATIKHRNESPITPEEKKTGETHPTNKEEGPATP